MIENTMDAIDPLVTALSRLCTREGGWKPVAQKMGTNDQSLYQIITGKKLPSGKPKGVGPNLRSLLDEHYPGWRTLHASPIGHAHAAHPPITVRDSASGADAHIQPKPLPPLTQVVEDLARHMRGLDPPLRSAIGPLVSDMCINPDKASITAQTIGAMLAVQGNSEAQKSTNSQAVQRR